MIARGGQRAFGHLGLGFLVGVVVFAVGTFHVVVQFVEALVVIAALELFAIGLLPVFVALGIGVIGHHAFLEVVQAGDGAAVAVLEHGPGQAEGAHQLVDQHVLKVVDEGILLAGAGGGVYFLDQLFDLVVDVDDQFILGGMHLLGLKVPVCGRYSLSYMLVHLIVVGTAAKWLSRPFACD